MGKGGRGQGRGYGVAVQPHSVVFVGTTLCLSSLPPPGGHGGKDPRGLTNNGERKELLEEGASPQVVAMPRLLFSSELAGHEPEVKNARSSWAAKGRPQSSRYGEEGTKGGGCGAQSHRS